MGVTALALAFTPVTAHAVAFISFDDGVLENFWTLTYDGTGGALVGAGINLNSIVAFGVDANSGTALNCVMCVLNFSTGNFISQVGSELTFGNGGVFTVTGTVQEFVTGNVVVGFNPDGSKATLLSGSFNGAFPHITNDSPGAFRGFGIDYKNADLLNFYGEADEANLWSFANTEITLAAGVLQGDGSLVWDVVNADITNTQSVPEPTTMLLFGSGLIGIAAYRRFKKSA